MSLRTILNENATRYSILLADPTQSSVSSIFQDLHHHLSLSPPNTRIPISFAGSVPKAIDCHTGEISTRPLLVFHISPYVLHSSSSLCTSEKTCGTISLQLRSVLVAIQQYTKRWWWARNYFLFKIRLTLYHRCPYPISHNERPWLGRSCCFSSLIITPSTF